MSGTGEVQVTPQNQVVQFSGLTGATGDSGRVTPWVSRKHTPYRKTPKARRIATPYDGTGRVQPRSRTPQRQNQVDDNLKGLVNKTWRAYKVTPLYQFSEAASKLRSYSRQLSAHIEAESRKGVVVGVESDVTDKATISVFRGLKINERDSESIQIECKSKPKTGNGEAKVSLVAILCCVGLDDDVEMPSEEFKALPLMLVKGPATLTEHLIQWLQMQFDCCASPMSFSSMDLSWVVAMWAGFVPDLKRQRKSVELVYSVPTECEGLKDITLNIDPLDCKNLWDCIHPEELSEFTCEQVSAFIKGIEAHFYEHFKIYLSSLFLSRVGTSVALMGCEARVKMFSVDHVVRVLQHLTQLAVEQAQLA